MIIEAVASSLRTPWSGRTAWLVGLGLGLGLGACRLPNPDHCFNVSVDGNAWCAEADPDRPWCSPCAYDDEHHGCVAEEPDPEQCPAYTSPATSSGTETGTGAETGTETGEQA